MTMTLGSADFFDTAAFALPPKVAKMDAVRKLAIRLTEVTGLGVEGALTLAEATVDPAAVRAALAEPLPGVTATRSAHLQVIPTRVWTPWVTPPADEIPRYMSEKRFPIADPTIPRTPSLKEDRDGLNLIWNSVADRDWHLRDNERIYNEDVHVSRLRIFPEKGGIITPLVLVPQMESFEDGNLPLRLLRIVDGRFRYYEVMNLLERFANLDAKGLEGHFGSDITSEVFRAALERDRVALGRIVNAVRTACSAAGDVNDFQHRLGIHYLASCLSVPAYIAVGVVNPKTSEITAMGADGSDLSGTLNRGLSQWHGGSLARVVAIGQRVVNGLLLPEASIDDDLIATATKRLRVRGVPKDVIHFGESPSTGGAAARFVWWCRAVRQLGGSPATAVAAFAQRTVADEAGSWPQGISRPLLACASHLMEEDFDTLYPPGDYRDAEARPDSLSLLVSDVRNLAPVAGLSSDGHGAVLAHPRFRNAVHIALAHLALIGALPAREPLPDRIVSHTHLLSRVATAWMRNQTAMFVKGDGTPYESGGRPVLIDERTLNRDDLPWPTDFERIVYMSSPEPVRLLGGASHAFRLRHDVIYTIPVDPLDDVTVSADPADIAAVVRRWFPGATGVVLTDWSDKYITGVMVGSVYVRLDDRRREQGDARNRGVWYPEGNPAGTKDILDFEDVNSGVPAGKLFGSAHWIGGGLIDCNEVDMFEVDEARTLELGDEIINEVDEALETQKTIDGQGGNGPAYRRPHDREVPVLRLPEPEREL